MTTTAPPPPPPGPPPPARVAIVIGGGLPVGGPRRVTVARGRRVILNVTSDVSDHIHLHGYDLMSDVAPEQPARIDFVADVAGVFECELEDAGLPLFELEIAP